MKRHESIVTFSREHHFGLLFCWKIRHGIKKQVPGEQILSYAKYFWENHLWRHFEEEETLLFCQLQDRLVGQALSEHGHIRQLMEMVISIKPVQTDLLSTLADMVDDHIRFEERILFPHIEKELPEKKLVELGKLFQHLHSGREKDDYPDEFWAE